ncbi:CYTH domain-containing protein [Marinospirillum alkaliphilum]|uniref:Inorganic triphosphatase YgiF, contains CYTH and CHAD domains n=1 Tax=Marinospirillum alkaliphilum DSM 21637 TaxID=1122209 RepID=A0A1K1V846_9GAMM|nr:CYTH domain-containing protein [Marinospirillum alkaliphilum]SFX20907.1 Inorganic triphosphatase YgiF, contains CYTH and CHAD domains [Marinospirillum alkaliphilum DSM 21637]
MASETELKLLIQEADQQRLEQLMNRLSATFEGSKRLENTYFDTPDLQLNQARIALRLRFTGQGWLQTLKTSGQKLGALSQRGEWEMPVADAQLQPELLPQGVLKPEWIDQLQPLFTTHFTRRTWLLKGKDEPADGGSSQPWAIEVAADLGEVALPQRHAKEAAKDSISELELELKAGDPQHLFDLAHQLANELVLHPGLASKAARGLRLLSSQPTNRKPSRKYPMPQLVQAGVAVTFAELNQLAQHQLNAWIECHESWAFNADEAELQEAQRCLLRLHALLVMQQRLCPAAKLTPLRRGVKRLLQAFQPLVEGCWQDRALQQLPLDHLPDRTAADWRYQQLAYAARRQQYRHCWHQPWVGQVALQLVESLWQNHHLQACAAADAPEKLLQAACEHLRFPRQPMDAGVWLQRYPALIRLQLLLQQVQPDNQTDAARAETLREGIETLNGYCHLLQRKDLPQGLQQQLKRQQQDLLLQLGRTAQALWTQ